MEVKKRRMDDGVEIVNKDGDLRWVAIFSVDELAFHTNGGQSYSMPYEVWRETWDEYYSWRRKQMAFETLDQAYQAASGIMQRTLRSPYTGKDTQADVIIDSITRANPASTYYIMARGPMNAQVYLSNMKEVDAFVEMVEIQRRQKL